MTHQPGLFVAIDGPKYTGKTTILPLVVELLSAQGYNVLLTKEPTPEFNLANEEQVQGIELARLIANDRAHHLIRVNEALQQVDVVITDRYIASSLGFHVLDGVRFDEVWRLNANFLLPHLNVFVTADLVSIAMRRASRGALSRLARNTTAEKERAWYEWVRDYMATQGVATAEVANPNSQTPAHTADQLANIILEHVRRHRE